jgi:hypothetical protein
LFLTYNQKIKIFLIFFLQMSSNINDIKSEVADVLRGKIKYNSPFIRIGEAVVSAEELKTFVKNEDNIFLNMECFRQQYNYATMNLLLIIKILKKLVKK